MNVKIGALWLCVTLCAGCDTEVVHAQTSNAPEKESPARVEAPVTLPLKILAEPPSGDVGTFEDLNDQVTLSAPSWLSSEPSITMLKAGDSTLYAYRGGALMGVALPDTGPVVNVESWRDRDDDGIPDHVDLLLGGLKTELNQATYLGGYEKLEYPGGDVSRDKGVCTDVVIRAARNAGVDLQVELYEDIKRSARSFPMVKKANPHIDQRRVKTLLPYFKRQWRALDVAFDNPNEPYVPGDIVFMQTMGDKRPDHLGIVSDRLGESGFPLIINNWTDGFSTSAMDIMPVAPVTHRFRLKHADIIVEPAHRGLNGVLTRQGATLAEQVERVILVTASSWIATRGTLRRYVRKDGVWSVVGSPQEVRLGSSGLGRGRGSDVVTSDWGLFGDPKKEGDRRSPTGIFTLGMAFGEASSAPGKTAWPWHKVRKGDVWVDDATAEAYNRFMAHDAPVTWSSAEDLRMYELGLVLEHKTSPVKAGEGSAIFFHPWDKAKSTTLGCTSMPRDALAELIGWLDPDVPTRVVQVVDEVF